MRTVRIKTRDARQGISTRHAAALALVGWYLLNSSVVWAQDRTFVAPDGSFSFRYSENLVNCKQLKDGWRPPESCTSYVPVCDDVLREEVHTPIQTSFACFGYPRNKVANSPIPEESDPIVGHQTTLEAATFSVETLDGEKTEKGCLAARPLVRTESRAGWTKINSVRFAVFDTGDAGTGSDMVGHAYRTFHRGKCYQLGVNLATSHGDFEPPVPELTKSDQSEISGTLQQARKSFRFLK